MTDQSDQPEQIPQVEPPKSRRTPIVIAIAAVVVIAAVVGIYSVTGSDDAAADRTTVTLGTVGASDPFWNTYVEEAAKEGIDLEIRDFADYAQPNPALAEGEIDINQFQHLVYLAEHNVASGDDLAPIGATATYPLGLYSSKVDSVDDIAEGDTVVVPDDDSNQARGLLVLQAAGLITLEGGGDAFSTIADIDESASKVNVRAIKADLTPTSLPDVAAAIINNDFVEKAGLRFEDAIAKDDPADPKALPYVNIFAVRAEDRDNPTYRKLVEIFQNSQAVKDGVQEVNGGTAQFEQTPVETLQKSLDDTEADARAAR
ncbi:methionine ABC transporter substrate-binding protein [Saccharomonospora sp. CUA-673]|uniref:MetQ/NlpA family ABC transporter substrate-binding protein n=1 Tax=Saccharomonospora sp. CUA-673 TaxID=1904969 RepID=UPI0009676518|nr:MetQ/NlpA family ABC transporter substrate-binding protein [Saccharomonospora sp. CUA-673]OLT47028.1 methionine ABC transporter substrate-binding protein [Saccharomonospora sp. CUA-673]